MDLLAVNMLGVISLQGFVCVWGFRLREGVLARQQGLSLSACR